MTETVLPSPARPTARSGSSKLVWLGAAAVLAAVIAAVALFGFGTTRSLSSATVGTADPSDYVVRTTECAPFFGDARAEGTLVSTAHERRDYAIRLVFHRDDRVVGGGTVVGSDVAPGTTLRWSLSDADPGPPHRGRLRCQVLIDDFPA